MDKSTAEAIRETFPVPAHIEAAAAAVRYDLLHGPSFVRIPGGDVEKFTADDFATLYEDVEDEAEPGDVVGETYTSAVADALRAFIADLPGTLYVEGWSGCVSTSEPEGSEDEETGEWIAPDWSDYTALDASDVIEALFGRTISREFS